MIEVRKHSCRQDTKGQWLVTIEIHPEDHANELVLAAKDTIFNISYEIANDAGASGDLAAIPDRNGSGSNIEHSKPSLGERIRTRAVLLCKDERFQSWFFGEWPATEEDLKRKAPEQRVTEWVRNQCKIESRAELATDVDAQMLFLELERRYREETGQVAEVRG